MDKSLRVWGITTLAILGILVLFVLSSPSEEVGSHAPNVLHSSEEQTPIRPVPQEEEPIEQKPETFKPLAQKEKEESPTSDSLLKAQQGEATPFQVVASTTDSRNRMNIRFVTEDPVPEKTGGVIPLAGTLAKGEYKSGFSLRLPAFVSDSMMRCTLIIRDAANQGEIRQDAYFLYTFQKGKRYEAAIEIREEYFDVQITGEKEYTPSDVPLQRFRTLEGNETLPYVSGDKSKP